MSEESKYAPKFKVDRSSSSLDLFPDHHYLISSIKRMDEEKFSMEYEINRLTNLLKRTSEKEAHWKKSFKEVKSEAFRLNEVAREAKETSERLKADLIIRENELQKISLENEELRKRETTLLAKVEVLTNSFGEKNDVYSKREVKFEECEKDYDVVPEWEMMSSFVRVSVNECENQKDENEDYDYDSEVDIEMLKSFKIDENETYSGNDGVKLVMMIRR